MLNFSTANYLLNQPNSKIDASIISIDQIRILISVLESTLRNNIPGDVVEFGCYVGESSKYLRMMLNKYDSDKELYVYDSFEGLPPLSSYEINTGWRSGTLKTSQEVLIENFISNNLKPPIVYKSWFSDIPSQAIPNNISFAFLDGDFYESIRDSLKIVYPRLSVGGCIIFHDYERPDLPGVKAAVDEYLLSLNYNSYICFRIFDQLGVLIKGS